KSAEKFRELKEATDFGVQATEVTFDFNQAQKRKETVVQSLFTGVKGLMKKHHIDVFQGFGRILGPSIFSPMPGTISIDHGEESENTMIVPKYVLIATGSRPRELPDMACDGEYVLHTDQALHLEELPDSLTIVGGGVIGIEWASMMVDLGVDVTVLEFRSDHGEESENTMIVPKYVLIATGSRPRELPDMACDGEYVLHTDQALHLEELPDSLTIVGGGVIGIEWASMMVDLGVDVTVLEF